MSAERRLQSKEADLAALQAESEAMQAKYKLEILEKEEEQRIRETDMHNLKVRERRIVDTPSDLVSSCVLIVCPPHVCCLGREGSDGGRPRRAAQGPPQAVE